MRWWLRRGSRAVEWGLALAVSRPAVDNLVDTAIDDLERSWKHVAAVAIASSATATNSGRPPRESQAGTRLALRIISFNSFVAFVISCSSTATG